MDLEVFRGGGTRVPELTRVDLDAARLASIAPGEQHCQDGQGGKGGQGGQDEDDDQEENDDHDQEVGEVSRSQYLMWIGNELSGAVKRISELSCLSFIPPGYIL